MIDIVDIVRDDSGHWRIVTLQDVLSKLSHSQPIEPTYESEKDAVDRHFYEAFASYVTGHD